MRRLVLLLLTLAAPAAARPATCLVRIDGTAVIDGPCDFKAFGGDGSFTAATPSGSLFAYVTVVGPGLADGYWNGERGASHAHDSLGRLARNEACWSNERATVCAW